MRSSFAVIFALMFLASCTTIPAKTEATLSYRQKLDIYKDMKIRIYKVARPLKIHGADICPSSQYSDGILAHSLFDYPERMRSVAQSYWGLAENSTRLYSSRLRGDACAGALLLSFEKQPRAHTDGQNIFITPSLLDEVDDLSLALIIAHELAHIALGHADKEPSEELEREADRFAVFMLARTDLDYRTAITQDAAHKRPHAQKNLTDTDTKNRAEHFRKVVLEIEALQVSGKGLVP